MDKLIFTSLDIEITRACNMACPYCYISKGDNKAKGDMTDDNLLKCVELLKRYGKSVVRPNAKEITGYITQPPTVHFYGGEPMLRFNKIKFIVDEIEKREVPARFTIFTNGTVGTEEDALYCKEHKINLVRGLNGCKAAQDVERPNSFDKYQEMSKRFGDEKGHRRMTTTPETTGYIFQSVKEIIEGGSSGATPMPDYYADWTPESAKEYIEQMKLVAQFYVERYKMGKPFYTMFIAKEAACRFSGIHSDVYCHAGRGLHCLNVDGYLMMCHRFCSEMSDSPFCFGHIDEILAGTAKGYEQIVKDRLVECASKIRPDKCTTCIGRAGCEQGCHHSNMKVTGSMNDPGWFYCFIHQEMSKIVDSIDKELRPVNPDWWTKNNVRAEVQMYLKRRMIANGHRYQALQNKGVQ